MAGAGIGSSRGGWPQGGSQHLTPWGALLEQARLERNWSQQRTVTEAGIKSTSVWTTTIYGGRMMGDKWKEIHPLAETLANLALALGLNARTVLKAAGYKYLPNEPVVYNLKPVPTDQLQGELRRRGELPEPGVPKQGSPSRRATRRAKTTTS